MHWHRFDFLQNFENRVEQLIEFFDRFIILINDAFNNDKRFLKARDKVGSCWSKSMVIQSNVFKSIGIQKNRIVMHVHFNSIRWTPSTSNEMTVELFVLKNLRIKIKTISQHIINYYCYYCFISLFGDRKHTNRWIKIIHIIYIYHRT